MTVLAPSHAFTGTRSDENNDSIVLRAVVDGGFTALLTGDVEPEAQRDLLDNHAALTADVLKVPHHGSDHQDSDFLRSSGARFGVASLGAGNTYGHPSPRTIAALHDTGLRTFRTDVDGSIAFSGTGGQLVAAGRKGIGTVGVAADPPSMSAPVLDATPPWLTDPSVSGDLAPPDGEPLPPGPVPSLPAPRGTSWPRAPPPATAAGPRSSAPAGRPSAPRARPHRPRHRPSRRGAWRGTPRRREHPR